MHCLSLQVNCHLLPDKNAMFCVFVFLPGPDTVLTGCRCTTWLIKLKEHDVSLIEFSVGEIKIKRRHQTWFGIEWKVRDGFNCAYIRKKNIYIYFVFRPFIPANIYEYLFIHLLSEWKINLRRTNSFIQYKSHHRCWVPWGNHFSITKIKSRFSLLRLERQLG